MSSDNPTPIVSDNEDDVDQEMVPSDVDADLKVPDGIAIGANHAPSLSQKKKSDATDNTNGHARKSRSDNQVEHIPKKHKKHVYVPKTAKELRDEEKARFERTGDRGKLKFALSKEEHELMRIDRDKEMPGHQKGRLLMKAMLAKFNKRIPEPAIGVANAAMAALVADVTARAVALGQSRFRNQDPHAHHVVLTPADISNVHLGAGLYPRIKRQEKSKKDRHAIKPTIKKAEKPKSISDAASPVPSKNATLSTTKSKFGLHQKTTSSSSSSSSLTVTSSA